MGGETTKDELVRAGYDPKALEKAKSLITTFKQFIEDNKDEIEAIQVLYSRPYRAGLRYRHVKELARLSAMEQSESLIQTNLRRASRLRQSILKQAFEGKLVPQDPCDEPASVLLEEIKSAATGSDIMKRSRKSAGTIRRPAAATKETESVRNEVS